MQPLFIPKGEDKVNWDFWKKEVYNKIGPCLDISPHRHLELARQKKSQALSDFCHINNPNTINCWDLKPAPHGINLETALSVTIPSYKSCYF